jgi:protocatechuate 3,4-dioxygenase beta subunit
MTAKKAKELADRRLVLQGLGGMGMMTLFDCGSGAGVASAGVERAGVAPLPGDGATCLLDPTLTKGPYWVDERLDRADIRSDTNNVASPNPRPGVPLTLRVTVLSFASGSCAPLPRAQVDVWHCDATGLYSDTAALGTAGQDFLRGFQRTDSNGAVTFTTVYPGWYRGRSIHIHVKVRLFDVLNNVTTEATTQLFFDDAVNNAVCKTASPYAARGVPDTSNARDGFYANHTELLLSLQGDAPTGYVGSIRLAVAVGTIATG